jgi:cytochrome c556
MQKSPFVFTAFAAFIVTVALADDDPRHVRHELMESVGDAAKPIGDMLKGERDFDAGTVMSSLETMDDVAAQFGDLFPEGTETGMDTEAAPAIWEDREGFEAALAEWSDAVDTAVSLQPHSTEELKQAAGPVFQACKNCHDSYRIED